MINRSRKNLLIIGVLLSFLLMLVSGCAAPSETNKETSKSNNLALAVKDDSGKTIIFDKVPNRVVCFSSSYLSLLDAVDANVVGKSFSKNIIAPNRYKNALNVGAVTNINIEKVISLRPDCVVGIEGIHNKFEAVLAQNNIKMIRLNGKTFKDVKRHLKILGKVFKTEDKAQKTIDDMDVSIKKTAANFDFKDLKIAVLHATAKYVTVELDNSIAGSIAKEINLNNIASKDLPISEKSDKTPFSLETLVERNPKILFITTMGNVEKIKDKLYESMKKNPAWNSLDAVRENHIIFLPENLFLINPGLKYPEAVNYMAQAVIKGEREK